MAPRRSFWPGAQEQYPGVSRKAVAYAELFVLQLTLSTRRKTGSEAGNAREWVGRRSQGKEHRNICEKTVDF